MELWACSARSNAVRPARAYHPDLSAADAVLAGRARKFQFFLTQPFITAEEATGWSGCFVSLQDTLDGCRRILDGEVDELPTDAFRYIGKIDEAHDLARTGQFRRFGT